MNKTPKRKSAAVDALKAITAQNKKDEAVAKKSRNKKFAQMLKAADAGVTYREIATLSGLSEIRVAQILRAEREAKL